MSEPHFAKCIPQNTTRGVWLRLEQQLLGFPPWKSQHTPASQVFQVVFFFFNLFWVALGLRCCVQAFSSCIEQGLLFDEVCSLLVAVASLVAEHGLQTHRLSSCGLRALERRLSSCGAWAQLLRGMWDLPGPGNRTHVPCIGRRILNHCATKEVPLGSLEAKYSVYLSECVPNLLNYRSSSCPLK